MQLTIDQHQVKLSNLDKTFWPAQGYSKGDLINYYIESYPLLEDYLKQRPISMKVYPDGIEGKHFFQKNCPEHAPDWLSTIPLPSGHKREYINWIVINSLSDLVWVINRATIELHCWFSTSSQPDKPDFAVFDLDPGSASGFAETVEVALLIKNVLDELRLAAYIKTSGKAGLHLYIPIKPIYSYQQVKNFLKSIAGLVIKMRPDLATLEWRKNKREGKVYIDYRQNGRGKTLPAPYSLRPTPQATISTPLVWSEVNSSLKPTDFTLKNNKDRLREQGNPWSNLFASSQELPGFLLGIFLFTIFFTGFNAGF